MSIDCPIVEISNENDVETALTYVRKGVRFGIRMNIRTPREERFRLFELFNDKASEIRNSFQTFKKVA